LSYVVLRMLLRCVFEFLQLDVYHLQSLPLVVMGTTKFLSHIVKIAA
jgi:hypothetical protein